MIQELEMPNVPPWLASVDSLTVNFNAFPLRELLSGSVYYPSSAFDGDPVKLLAGNFLSFVYVDYSLSEDELDRELANRGFRGFEIVARRKVSSEELAPCGWAPVNPLPGDGNPGDYSRHVKQPFAQWLVFQRRTDFTAEHGPVRFSLLYLCADGVAAFQALYCSNGIRPGAVAIIQPGTGFGFNWTDFRDPRQIFFRSVMGNPAGAPAYLVWGEGDRSPETCWPKYGRLVKMLWTGSRQIGVWERGPADR